MNGLTIRRKFTFVLSTLVIICALSGGMGVFFVKSIFNEVDTAALALNVSAETTKLLNLLKAYHSTTIDSANSTDDAKIAEKQEKLAGLQDQLNSTLSRLTLLSQQIKSTTHVDAIAALKDQYIKQAQASVSLQESAAQNQKTLTANWLEIRDLMELIREEMRALKDLAKTTLTENNKQFSKLQAERSELDKAISILSNTYDLSLPAQLGTADMLANLTDIKILLENYLATMDDPALLGAIEAQSQAKLQAITDRLENISDILTTFDDTLYEDTAINLEELEELLFAEDILFSTYKAQLEIANAQTDSMQLLERSINELAAQLEQLNASNQTLAEAAQTTSRQYKDQSMSLIVIFTVLGTSIGLFLGQRIMRAIVAPIHDITSVARAVAQGDLCTTVTRTSQDELGHLSSAINEMQASLANLLTDIAQSSASLSETASHLDSNSKLVKQQVAKKHDQTDAATQSVTALVSGSKLIHTKTNTAVNHIHQANVFAKETADVVSATITSIEQVVGQINEVTTMIEQVAASTNQISSVTNIIQNIAEQTNLLALNAAIESARAGDQGRGFAVVADEVRALASRTQESTAEISTIIQTLYSRTQDCVGAIETAKTLASTANTRVTSVGEKSNQLEVIFNEVGNLINDIATETANQIDTTTHIQTSITHINTATNNTLNSAEQTASSSEQIGTFAQRLQQATTRFKLPPK